MFIVRTIAIGKDLQAPAFSRDSKHETKRNALIFIRSMGQLSSIIRLGKLYIVTPKVKQN